MSHFDYMCKKCGALCRYGIEHECDTETALKKPFNLNRPPHLVANELVRNIEDYLFDNDVKVTFGEEGHQIVEGFVDACNLQVERYYDEAAQSYIEAQELRKLCERAAVQLASLATKTTRPIPQSLRDLIDELQGVAQKGEADGR